MPPVGSNHNLRHTHTHTQKALLPNSLQRKEIKKARSLDVTLGPMNRSCVNPGFINTPFPITTRESNGKLGSDISVPGRWWGRAGAQQDERQKSPTSEPPNSGELRDQMRLMLKALHGAFKWNHKLRRGTH